MMFLAGLAVVFAGLLGGKGKVDAQVKRVVRDLHVEVKPLPRAKLRTLTRHTGDTRDLVRGLHTDGVIACEIVGGKTLRIVIYEGDGTLKTFTELPLTRRGLTAADLKVLRENLRSEVIALRDSDAPDPAPAPATTNVDTEDPLGGTSSSTTPPPTKVASADDADSDAELGLVAEKQSEPAAKRTTPWFGLSVGGGVATRSFDPGTAMVTPYTSTPVPTLAVDAYVQPFRRLAIHLGGERTLRLSTEMGDGSSVSTAIARWHGSVDYAVVQGGAIALAARLGAGRRSFVIATDDPDRSPDRAYNYVIAGFTASARLGRRIALLANAAFEPVLSESAGMTSGESGRWALDVGAGVEVRAAKHVFVRAAASYQRFSWSWLTAGTGIASDAYPSGALSLGADY
ncbi:MAG TPA: hypothetical protein VFS15_23135 [Kofleriaceae bacterium]|nr:hypothetical protein [Kofleriaceae bacterium]